MLREGGRALGGAVGRGVVRSALLANVADRLFARSLRIVAYHTVPDGAVFRAQMEWLAQRYTAVGQDAVLAALDGAPLPPMAVWVTFDDGDPSVVREGLPALWASKVPATMFVCPGLIESGELPWWERVERAALPSLRALIPVPIGSPQDAVAYLKTVPDRERREVVAVLPRSDVGDQQLSDTELDRWLDAGLCVGNHSWDHPCLDRCPEAEQRDQVARADAWLRARIPGWVGVFAYPNGNWSSTVEDELARRGYSAGLLHDHRLARSLENRYRISRLDVRANDGVPRFRGVVSGLHPVLSVAESLPRRQLSVG